MGSMNNDFIKELCEYIYGDEFTQYDTKNILRNIKPAYEGTGVLKFGTIKNSEHFMEFVVELWESKQRLYEQRRSYKKDLKIDKDYKLVCKLLQTERIDFENEKLKMFDECKKIEEGHLENSIIHKKALLTIKKLNYTCNDLIKKLDNQDELRKQITSLSVDKAEIELRYKEYYQERYNKNDKERIKEFVKKENQLNTEKDKEIEKFKKDFVRQDDKICHMEKNNEIKLLKEEMKKLKNQNSKFKKQMIESMD